MNSSRMNRLEELGRVDSEKAYTKAGKANLSDEKSRIVRELKAEGGQVGKKRKPQPSPGPKAGKRKRKMGRGAQGSKKKEISADNKRRIAFMDGAKETVTGGGMKADRFKEGLNIKGSKSSAMKFYARGDTDHGKLGQKKYKSLKNNTYANGGMVNVSGRGQGKVMSGRNKKTYIC